MGLRRPARIDQEVRSMIKTFYDPGLVEKGRQVRIPPQLLVSGVPEAIGENLFLAQRTELQEAIVWKISFLPQTRTIFQLDLREGCPGCLMR